MRNQSQHRLASYLRSWDLRIAARYSLGVMCFILCSVILASLSNKVFGASFSESFTSTEPLAATGLLVSISKNTPSAIELANINNNRYLTGVVEDENVSLLALKTESRDIAVASVGETEALVSDVNGPIEPGDFVGTSWINGVAMRANTDVEQKVLGVALEGFDDNSENTQTVTGIQTESGEKNARVGRIPVRIATQDVGPSDGSSVSQVVTFAQRIAGKDVTVVRVFAAIGLLFISLFVSAVFLVNAIRNSFISIGRNPLASNTIFVSLLQVSGVSVMVILVGAAFAYGLLVI